MRSTASIQIGFKVTPEVAEKLEALAQPLRMSRSLVAKELVLAALASERSGQPIDLLKHRVADAKATLNGDDPESDRTEAEDLMQDLLLCLKNQNGFVHELRLLMDELAALRQQDVPALRTDIQTSVAAILCQTGASVENAKAWVTRHLGANSPGS